MADLSAVGRTHIVLVKQKYSASNVQSNLNEKGFKALRLGRLVGTNIFRVNRINLDQYESFNLLLSAIKKYIKDNFSIGDNERLPLILPKVEELRKIRFDKLIASKQAMQEVMSRCVMPKGKAKVDLEILPWIYKEYAAGE